MSPMSQNEFIECLASVLLTKLLQPLRDAQREGTIFGGFSVLTDEAADSGGLEQIAVVVRFATPTAVQEIFTDVSSAQSPLVLPSKRDCLNN